MEKFRFNKLGIEIEIIGGVNLEIRETKNCIKISYKNKKIVTVLQDSKIEFLNLSHIVCYKGRVVAFGDALIEAGGASRVFARDKVCVVAGQGAEVRANGRAKVRAHDNSRVIAGGRAEVFLEGKSIGYKKSHSRVKMNRLDNRAAVFDID